MKKMENLSTPAYEYLDQIRPYFNSPCAMHLALEREFGMAREHALHCVRKWLEYVDRKTYHPFERRNFLQWRLQLSAADA